METSGGWTGWGFCKYIPGTSWNLNDLCDLCVVFGKKKTRSSEPRGPCPTSPANEFSQIYPVGDLAEIPVLGAIDADLTDIESFFVRSMSRSVDVVKVAGLHVVWCGFLGRPDDKKRHHGA